MFARKPAHRLDRRLAYVVLDALGVDLGLLPRHAEGQQKSEDDLVALLRPCGEAPAFRSQMNRPARLGVDEAFVVNASHDPRHRDMADAHHLSEVLHAGLAAFVDELGDGLDVVLGGLVAVGGPCRAEPCGGVGLSASGHARLRCMRSGGAIIPAQRDPRNPAPLATIAFMSKRIAHMPAALLRQTRLERLASGEIPALLAHPDWSTPAPVMLWMHGRTVHKELDPGRYLRWIRAGIAACAVDLPGHGERFEESLQSPDHTLHVVKQMLGEIDRVVEELAHPRWKGVFDLDRMGIGGMSAGGMATLRRLCDEHEFRCAAVESTAGDFSHMPYMQRYEPELIDEMDPVKHLDGWRPTPLLALHSETDEWVPVSAIRSLCEQIRRHDKEQGADPGLMTLKTWPETGAPNEHAGFGRMAHEAKNLQVEFLRQHLGGVEVVDS
ncbi:MAG: hypothetical protein EA376_10075 [Phycisphaeraceae bacterium]|nr:MAG: hypothetical protein EA376_10075 [Phycisphaeraceae bacterium]